MISSQIASSLSQAYSDSDMLFLWFKVFGFIGLLCASAYFLSLYAKKRRFGIGHNNSEKIRFICFKRNCSPGGVACRSQTDIDFSIGFCAER